ncbi:MAG: AIR synthase related protein [Syntrophales bacterium]|nr:AIR synthase related protein [Syntrophales bacterium]
MTAINDDDCAVMRRGSSLLVVTMDFVNSHPIVMELGIGSWDTLGRLVVAANLSDLCGTGAKPVAMLIGITMPYGSLTEQFKRIIHGIKQETQRHGIPVIGGDTKLGHSFAIVGVAMGSAGSSKNLFLRNGARPGDLLWDPAALVPVQRQS